MKSLAPLMPEPLPPYEAVDFLNTDSLLTDDERALRAKVRKWVDSRLMPIITECHFEGRFPSELVPEMAALGLLGPTIPKEYGGPGRSSTDYGIIMQELERCDSGVRSFGRCRVRSYVSDLRLLSEEQKRRWLPSLAQGTDIGCFGLTEPEFGSNPAGMIVTATETADGWTLHGRKKWLSNGPSATIAIVWAKTNGDNPKSIRGFIVPTGLPGVT